MALLQIGGAGGVLVSSSNNNLSGVLPDVTLTLKSTSVSAVTISATQSNAGFVDAVKSLVTTYNSLQSRLQTLTSFNADTNTRAVLQGESSTLRVQSDLNQLVSGRFFGVGPIQSLKQIGIEFDDKGQMKLDEATLQVKLGESPESLKSFFNTAEIGVAAKFDKLIETMAGVGTSLLVSRAAALTRKYESNLSRIEAMNARLERQRERMTNQFAQLELTISKIQSNQTYINQIANISAKF